VYNRSQSAVLGDTYSVTPTLVNSAHATWTRLRIDRGSASNFISPKDVGINIFNAVPNFVEMAINGYFDIGCGTCAPAYFNNNSVQLADDVDMMRGRHHLSFGVDWIHNQLNSSNVHLANGSYTFNGQFSGDALLDFILGAPNDFSQGNSAVVNFRQNYIGTYIEDDVRLSKRFNIQLGLRWEPFLPQHDIFNRQSHFDAGAFAEAKKTSQFVNAPPGLFFPGDPGMPGGVAYTKLADFEPRVGWVWDPTGSGRQTIRAGYGIFYDTPELFYAADASNNNAPWGSTIDIPSPAGGLTNPYLGYAGGDPFPLPIPPSRNATFPPAGTYYTYPLDLQPTYMQQWDFSYQRQLGNDWLISATYMGNKTTHLWTGEDVNPARYIPGTCSGKPCSTTSNTTQRRVLYLENSVTGALYSHIYQGDDGANAEYNALLLTAQHRFSAHYTILANYTYSHCISEGDFAGDLGGPQTQDLYNRNAERGNCGFDLRHILNLSFIAGTPQFANPWTERLLGHWQLSPIVSIHSGTWFSPSTGVDNSLTNVGLDRPNSVGNPYVKNTSTRQWIAAGGFVPNPLGTFGNAGRDSLVGPGYFDIDADVSRFFNISEHQRLELRFEFFNLTNQVNFNNPNGNLHSSTFGLITSDAGPRILQFALKYYF
ncbi:MAG: carboxypeptidase regulatory-like domain-containing protein, partial [Terriglobia bacterium]